MDKDVESKLEKLCLQYLRAASALEMVRPTRLPTQKQWYRTEAKARDIVEGLKEIRAAPAAALVKLAYVRGLRVSQPSATLSESQLKEVEYLQSQLDRELEQIERCSLRGLREQMRKLKLANQLSKSGVPEVLVQACQASGKPYPLEQRARARVRAIVEVASAAGALAGTSSDGYDTARNADAA